MTSFETFGEGRSLMPVEAFLMLKDWSVCGLRAPRWRVTFGSGTMGHDPQGARNSVVATNTVSVPKIRCPITSKDPVSHLVSEASTPAEKPKSLGTAPFLADSNPPKETKR